MKFHLFCFIPFLTENMFAIFFCSILCCICQISLIISLIALPLIDIQVNIVSSSSLTGPLYYIYMALLAVFCTNTINIYAGINGLESGQTVVAAASVAVFNIIELSSHNAVSHYISLCLLLPFIATSLALYYHNRYGNCTTMLLFFTFPNYLTHISPCLLNKQILKRVNFVFEVAFYFLYSLQKKHCHCSPNPQHVI